MVVYREVESVFTGIWFSGTISQSSKTPSSVYNELDKSVHQLHFRLAYCADLSCCLSGATAGKSGIWMLVLLVCQVTDRACSELEEGALCPIAGRAECVQASENCHHDFSKVMAL